MSITTHDKYKRLDSDFYLYTTAMNNELNEKNYLLSPKGLLVQTGRAKAMAYEYDRLAVPPFRRLLRLKEHDRYIFGNSRVQIELSLADYGYACAVCASVADMENRTEKTTVLTAPLSPGGLELQATPDWGDVIFRAGGDASIDFSKSTGRRYIRGRIERFDDVRSLYVNVVLDEPQSEQFCTAEGRAEDPECFRLCHKIMNMTASGTAVYGADTYTLSSADSIGCLDWERAVFPSGAKYSWYCAQGCFNDVPFSFSLSSQGELLEPCCNAVIYDGTVYDPGAVRVYQKHDNHEGELDVRSSNGRLELSFTPIVSRNATTELLRLPIAGSSLTYGLWNGRIKVGSKVIILRDVMGFAEKGGFRW